MGESRKSSQPGASQGLFGEQPFEIFLVTDSLTDVVSRVESEGSADANGLKMSPDIAFKARVFAGHSGTERSDEMTVILVVSDQDAAKLKELSENNFGKRTLVACHKKVIAAPAITAPIASKQFTFTVKDSRVLESLRRE